MTAQYGHPPPMFPPLNHMRYPVPPVDHQKIGPIKSQPIRIPPHQTRLVSHTVRPVVLLLALCVLLVRELTTAALTGFLLNISAIKCSIFK